MKKKAWSILVCIAFSFSLMSFAGFDLKPARAADGYLSQSGIYQGENNWYYFSGDFENGLTRMFYNQSGNLWQGETQHNRIYLSDMAQTVAGGFDSVRALVLSDDCTVTLTGSIVNGCSAAHSGVEVKIVLRRDGAADNVLYSNTFVFGDANIDLAAVAAVQGIQAKAGDTLFFVVTDTAAYVSGIAGIASFRVVPAYSNVTKKPLENILVDSSSMSLKSGDLKLAAVGNRVKDTDDCVLGSMAVDNTNGYQFMVYRPHGGTGTQKLTYAVNEPGSPYRMNTTEDTACFTVWVNEMWSNGGDRGQVGVQYTVKADGKMSILGANMGAAEVTGYDIGIIRSGIWIPLASGSNTGKTDSDLVWYEEIAALSDIDVKLNDRVVYISTATGAWQTASAAIVFDYQAYPARVNTGYTASGDITQAQYNSVNGAEQNTDGWYYMYGNPLSNYYELGYNTETSAWTDTESTISMSRLSVVSPSERHQAIRMWRSGEDGTARITGNVTLGKNSVDGVTFKIYKRSYGSGSYGAAELFESVEIKITARDRFFEFNFTDVAIKGGDMFFFCIGANDNATGDIVTMNTFVSFSGSGTGEIGDGDTGASDNNLKDWYSKTQNTNGWFYAAGTPQKYVMMTYGFGDNNTARWNGTEWNVSIESDRLNPGAYMGVMRIFVADRSGTYKITGSATMLRTDGDGTVRTAVYKNADCIWEHSFLNTERNEVEALSAELAEITLAKGDKLFFYAEYVMGDRVAYDTRCNFDIDLERLTDDGDYDEEKDLADYLSPVTFKDYYGIHVDDGATQNDPDERGNKGGLSAADIALLAVGGAVLAAGIALFFVLRRKKV